MKVHLPGWARTRLLVKLAVGALGAALTSLTIAADFTVSPVRIFMEPNDRAIALTITNEGNEPLVMQADLYNWHQNDLSGEDELELTEDLFLSPPIIQLQPLSRQVVRLARMSNAVPPEQLTYRLIVREIPEAAPPEDGLAVQVALALSLPVFISPINAQARLDCTLERLSPESLDVWCENVGSAYAQPRQITLTDTDGKDLITLEPAAYILPGIRRRYELTSEQPIPAGNWTLSVIMDDTSTQSFEVSIQE
jgi:fimbrial chaperone protein